MPMHPKNPYGQVTAAQGIPPVATPQAPRLGLLTDPARAGHIDPAAPPIASPRMAAGMVRSNAAPVPRMPMSRDDGLASSAIRAANAAGMAATMDTMAKRGLTRKADRVSKVFGRDTAPPARQEFLRDKLEKMASNQGLLGRQFLKRGDY